MFAVGASFAADGNVTLGEVDDEMAIDDNVLSVDENNEALSADEEGSEVVSASATVTNSTFHDYFDDQGTLLDTVTADELEFEGDFSNVNVNYITIDRSIKFTGKNAIFNGVSFAIMANDVVIDGFNLTGSDYALITISDVSNVSISNCNISFTAMEGSDSFAIYASSVENLKILSNTITYVGNTEGTTINNAIYVEGDTNSRKASKNINVEGNTFDIAIPSVEINYMTTPYTTYSEGIVFFYCEDVKFVDNRVDLRYNTFTLGKTSPDSIYALGVKSNENIYEYDWDDDDNLIFTYPITSKNIVISGNTFNVKGHNHTYALEVAADNFNISNNKFNVTSEVYSNAITLNHLSYNGNVKDNVVFVTASDAVYGFYSFAWAAPITDITYKNNTINAQAYMACGMEFAVDNTVIDSNVITTNGNYTYGIALSLRGDSTKGIVFNNTIYNLGSNVGVDETGDPLTPKGSSMAITVKSYSENVDVTIKENNIYSTNIGINVVKESEKIILDNNTVSVVANSGKANNYAIVADDVNNLTIINNDVSYSGLVDYQFVIIEYDSWGYPIYDTSNNTRAYGVYVKNSNVVIRDNDFDIAIPTFAVNWGATRESFSEGIVLAGCDDLEFTNNNLTITINGGSSWDTVYGIDILNSANPAVKNNNITLDGRGYAYALIINDKNFNISGNKIGVVSDNYACGIDVEGPANGLINKNTISLKAAESAYGIYTGMTSGDVNVNITSNDVDAEAYYVVALEIAAKTALIENNNIDANGNHTIGVGTKVSDVTIKDNAINAFASNEGDQSVWDAMGTLNSAIKVIEGNATIYNNVIASNAIGINVDSTNDKVNIEKNIIVVNANSGKVDNYAIVAEDIEDLSIINNDVTYSGLVENQFVIIGYDSWGYPIYDTSNNTRAYGVYVKNSNVVIRDNEFEIAIPTFAVNWGLTREAFSEGIVLVGCDDLEFINNNVTITANGGTSWDTVYGIDILNSANPAVKNNNITLDGRGYAYGLIINDENFDISENNIGVTSDNYACGIDVEGTANGNITKNTISATAADSAYPIYSGMNYMPVSVDIVDNKISGEAYYVVGVEVGGNKVLLENNDIDVKGNHTIGVGAYLDEIVINNNNITSDASNVGDVPVWDNFGTDTTGVKIVKGNFTISNNDIETTGDYAVNSGDASGNITNNELLSSNGEGDNSIIGLGDVNSTGNPATHNKYLKVIMFANDLTKVYGSADQFIAKVLDENGQPVYNKTITFVLSTGETFTATTDADGFAKLDIDLVKGEYLITSRFAGDSEYGAKSITSNIVVNAKPTALTAPDASVLLTAVKKGYNYKITLKDNSGKVLANQKVTINGKAFTTDKNGVVTYKVSASKAGTQKLTVKFEGDDKYAASSKTATIKITKEATKLTAKNKKFKKSLKVKKYAVTLKDSKGKAIKGAKLTLKVKNKTFKATTNAKGKATFKIKKLTKKGKFSGKVTFTGNDLYNKVAKSVKITLK
jgi:hypothetical protein